MSCPLGEKLNCACSGRIPGGGVNYCSKLQVPTWGPGEPSETEVKRLRERVRNIPYFTVK